MNALLLLMGLLVLSYIGSFLVGGRAIRGFGLPSGSEYVALGFVIGPSALGLVERSMLDTFEPLADVALGWLAFVLGMDYAFLGRKRVRAKRFLAASLLALLTGGGVAAAEWYLLTKFFPMPRQEALLLAGAIGVACSETTRHAVRWAVERHRAAGPLSELLAELADCDDLIPLVGAAAIFALAPADQVHLMIPQWGWVAITIGLGVVIGAIAATLLGREFRLHESWGVLLGTSLFAIGMAARLNLSALCVTFFMGIALAAFTRHREEIEAMVAPTERPVLLPALLLAGARINPHAMPRLPIIIGVALATRIAVKIVASMLLRLSSRTARRAGPLLGFALLPSGELAMAMGLAFALRFQGPLGDTVLATVAAITIFGEFVGPVALRSVLTGAGEIGEAILLPDPDSPEVENAIPSVGERPSTRMPASERLAVADARPSGREKTSRGANS